MEQLKFGTEHNRNKNKSDQIITYKIFNNHHPQLIIVSLVNIQSLKNPFSKNKFTNQRMNNVRIKI